MIDLPTTKLLANIVATFSGLVAAYYWLRASKAKVFDGEESDSEGYGRAELIDIYPDGTKVNATASARKQTKLGGLGALWGAIAAASIAVSQIADIIISNPALRVSFEAKGAQALNVAGLCSGIVGVIVVFIFGWPQPDLDHRNKLVVEGDEAINIPTLRKRENYRIWSSCGLGLIILGFCFQLFSAI